MVDFYKPVEVRQWLEAQPREASVAIVARVALRALPLIVNARPADTGMFSSIIALPCFRAAAVAWVAANYPTQFGTLRAPAAAAAAAIDAARVYPAVILGATDFASVSARNALSALNAAAVFAAGMTGDVFEAAVASAITAVTALVPVTGPTGPNTATNAVKADAELIEAGGSRDKTAALAVELAKRPLWPGTPPPWFAQALPQLETTLLAADDDWEVWIEWYEDRLFGRSSDQELELARTLLPDSLWQQAPKTINSEIKRLIAEARNAGNALPSERSLPPLTPSAAIFEPNASGLIEIAPPGPRDRLANIDPVRDFYLDVRAKSADLAELGPNMLGARLSKAVLTFQDRSPAQITDAVERRVWSSGNTLRIILAAHDAVADDRDPHPAKLDRGAAETLRDVVETFNQLAFADPALRQRDERRPGPQEHNHAITEVEIVVEVAAKAATDRSITTLEAGEELAEQIDAARQTAPGLTGRLALEFARDTHRNFFAGAVIAAYRAMRNLPEAARGERGFISKEVFSGVYKAVGATAFATALMATTAACGIRWEILDFIISNADVLKAYAALAFQHSPGFRQMIEWLELHVISEKKVQSRQRSDQRP